MERRIIGIIGGAGVAAGAELVSRLEQKMTARGAFRDSHHPEVILYQATQVPSRSMFLEGRGESFVPGYVAVGKKLKAAGAAVLCMCCNTAHYAIDELQEKIGLPFINLLHENLRRAIRLAPDGRVGVICSSGASSARLYEKAASQLDAAVQILEPDDAHQALVTQGICNIKKAYHRTHRLDEAERPRTLFSAAARHLFERGAEVVVLGCTEVPLDAPEPLSIPVVDSIDVLADACLEAHANGSVAC